MNDQGVKITLHAYDLSRGMAKAMSQSLLGTHLEGIWHTGIVAFGVEYYWGGVLQQLPAGQTPYGFPTKTFDLGQTFLDKETFDAWIQEVSSQYTLETYDVFRFNCNNFSQAACQFLTGGNIPAEISNLPQTVLNSPMGAMLRPMVENFQNTVKSDMRNEFGSQFHWTAPQQQAQQQAAVNTFNWPAYTPANAASAALPNAATAPAPAPAKLPAPKVEASKVLAPLEARKPLLADQRLDDASGFATKISALPSLKDVVQPSDVEALETIAHHISAKPKPGKVYQPLSATHVTTLVDLIKKCSSADGFSLLFLLRLVILHPAGQQAFLSDVSFVESVVAKFIVKQSSLAANHTSKVMAFLVASNLFSTLEMRRVMIAKRNRSLLLDQLVKAVNSKKKDLRLAATGLLINYSSFLIGAGLDDTTEDATQLGSAIIELLQRIDSELSEPANAEFGNRLLTSLGYLLYSHTTIRELAVALGVTGVLESIKDKCAAKAPKLASLALEVIQVVE